jgi:hypothetical protein
MDYIQSLFLKVQVYMQQHREPDELIAFLDAEPPLFRSVAYESASMEIAMPELRHGRTLENWNTLYRSAEKAHTFHMDIGLGWAFAKTEISPESHQPHTKMMVYDGIGYYYGLFKGRKTVKNHLVPEGINEQQQFGFDQGLGRRLWYISRGEVNELADIIKFFPVTRQANLWRGVGIACAYVGGCEKEALEHLQIASAGFHEQLYTGVTLAAISRKASDSITPDIDVACNIICGKSLENIVSDNEGFEKLFYTGLESIK